jgi:DNA polymerase-3 subunit beta
LVVLIVAWLIVTIRPLLALVSVFLVRAISVPASKSNFNILLLEFSLTVKVNLREFYNAIDRASLLTNENEKNTIRFETKDDYVIISSNTPELGYVEETINIEKNNNEDLKIAFSSKYMLDALKSMECEEINLMFNGDIKPIIMKNPNNSDLLQLILPIRTY